MTTISVADVNKKRAQLIEKFNEIMSANRSNNPKKTTKSPKKSRSIIAFNQTQNEFISSSMPFFKKSNHLKEQQGVEEVEIIQSFCVPIHHL